MAVYILSNSQFAQGIWASICSGFATITTYALYIVIMLLGIALMLGAVGSRSVGRTTQGFTNVILAVVRTVVAFIAVQCVWRAIKWIGKRIATFWKWLQKQTEKIFQKKMSLKASKALSGVAATLIIAVIILII